MSTKKFKCPGCNTVFLFDESKLKKELIKEHTCPKCKSQIKVKLEPLKEPVILSFINASIGCGATQLGGGLSGATVLGGIQSGETQLVVPSEKAVITPRLSFDGNDYSLQEGQNIVGRKASSSQATVQIETTDRYMSRQHISITISTLPDGSKKAVLSNYQNKNQTVINGKEITNTDVIRLIDGDKITMGHTTVEFKL